MQMHSESVEQLKAFARGELTWAQVEGMTSQQAEGIARAGCELAAAGRLEEARVLFEGLVAGNPQDAAAQAALGTVYQKLGRLPQALEAYGKALEQDPRHPVALVNRGELYLRQGNKQGFTDVANAVEADPKGQTSAGRRARGLVNAITLAAVEQLQQKQQRPKA